MISFDDTRVAFHRKNKAELRKGYYLFKALSHTSFVKLGTNAMNLAEKTHLPVKGLVKPTIYSHFCGGETLAECQKLVDELSQYDVRAILDFAVEGKDNEDDMKAAMQETLMTISNAARQTNIPFAVFKPTAFCKRAVLEAASTACDLALEVLTEADNFRKRVDILCQHAYNLNVPIMIDAEDFCYQHFIDEVVTDMMTKYNRQRAIVFNTLQMYRTDRLQYLVEAHQKAVDSNYYLGIKFVRGAYMERERLRAIEKGYSSPIHIDKPFTDMDFDAGLQFSVENLDRITIFCGTHNELSCKYLIQLMDEHGIEADDKRVWFSQLYGMSDNITFNLASEGYNVAKYIPYGLVKHTLPYLIRRAEENSAIAGQTTRELNLISKERERRKIED